jgi:HK97 family phage portal protein
VGGATVLASVPAEDVLHFKNTFLTDDYYMGEPTVRYAMKTLSIAATADDQTLKDMAKGGKHKVLIQEEKSPTTGTRGRADKKQLRNMADEFAEDWLSRDVVLLDNVADAKIISQTAAELRSLETRGYEVNDIARLLGVPRIMMMEDQGSSYKMPEHATQEFLLRTIQPRVREWEDELNSKLLTAADFGRRRIHVCELALRRLDAKGQAEIDKLHLETGVNTVNELRNQYDLPSVKGGDINYVSTNLAELGSDKLRSNGGGRPSNNENENENKNSLPPTPPEEKGEGENEKGGES